MALGCGSSPNFGGFLFNIYSFGLPRPIIKSHPEKKVRVARKAPQNFVVPL